MTELTSLVGSRFAELSAYGTRPDPAPVKLDANESPWPLPDDVRRELAEVLAAAPLHRYPDLLARDVHQALARWLGVASETLLSGVGSDEIIGLLIRVLDRPRPGRETATVLFPSPSFVMYPITAKVHGVTPVEVPLDHEFGLDVPAMCRAIETHRPNLVFLASPNNPTGNAFDPAAVEAVVDAARDSLVVIDEAYAPFAGTTLRPWLDRHDNVAVMGTLSKIGLAGLRLGWVQMAPSLVREVNKARPPYNLAMPTQHAAAHLLGHHASVLASQVERIVAERARLRSSLASLPLVRAWPSAANFVLIELDEAADVHRALLAHGVQVRRFKNVPRLERHLRVSIGTPDENDRFLQALRTTLAS